MALQTAIPVSFDAYFPRGAFAVGSVEPVVKWSDDGERQGRISTRTPATRSGRSA